MPEWIQAIEEEAQKQHIPIMDQVSMQFVSQIIRLVRPKHILEIGTAIGYSALRMLDVYPQTMITTIERDEDRYNRAKQIIADNKKEDRIHLIFGDAKDVLSSLQTTGYVFDFAFIDAAKGQYQSFFEKTDPLIQPGGMILSDNVLFQGHVASDEEIDKKHRTIVNRLRSYNKWLMNHDDYQTSIVPVGDGIAISIKEKPLDSN